MDGATELISLLWIPALPLLAALAGELLAPRLRRDPARFAALTLQLCVGGALLASFLALSAIGGLFADTGAARIQETAWTWIEVGTTTALRLDLSLDHLTGTVVVALLGFTLCALLAAAGRPRQLLRISAALGAALLTVLGDSLLVVALGWHLLGAFVVVSGERPAKPRLRALALADAALWIAVGAMAYGAGAPTISQITRACLQGEASRLAVLNFGGVSVAALAVLSLTTALVARGLGSPRARRGPATPDGPLAALLSGPIALLLAIYLLLRLSPVLALGAGTGTGALPIVASLGAGLALVATIRALVRPSPRDALTWVSRAHLGLVILGVGVRAWVPALVLALILSATRLGLGLASTSQPEKAETHRPWTRLGAALNGLAAAGATPLGILPPIALIAAAAWGLGGSSRPLAALLVAVTGLLALALARAQRRLYGERPGRPREEPFVALPTIILGVTALGLGVLCLPALLGATGMPNLIALDPWPELLQPALRLTDLLAPAATTGTQLLSGLFVLRLAGAWIGTAAGRRLPATTGPTGPLPVVMGALSRPILTVASAPGALLRWVEGLLAELRAWIYRRLWLANANPRPQVVLALLIGLAATLGVIYCNPNVIVVGPTEVHPVDLGGINPLIRSPKRDAKAKAKANVERSTAAKPPAEPNPIEQALPPPVEEDYSR